MCDQLASAVGLSAASRPSFWRSGRRRRRSGRRRSGRRRSGRRRRRYLTATEERGHALDEGIHSSCEHHVLEEKGRRFERMGWRRDLSACLVILAPVTSQNLPLVCLNAGSGVRRGGGVSDTKHSIT